MSALQAVQSDFQDFILEGRDAVGAHIMAGDGIDPARRLGIYFHAYRARLIEALQTDYTALIGVLGEDEFRLMAQAFVQATPSIHRNLRWYGQSLPEFLRITQPYTSQPWLSELALFEWTITLAFDAADDVPMTFAQMAALDPALWPELCLRFHPSYQRLSMRTNAVSLRKAVDEERTLPAPGVHTDITQWLLWRKDLTVVFRSLSPEETWAIDTARAGGSFTELCDGLCQWVEANEAAARLAGMLRNWVDEQLIIAAG